MLMVSRIDVLIGILRYGAGWREEKRVGSDPQLFVPHTFICLPTDRRVP